MSGHVRNGVLLGSLLLLKLGCWGEAFSECRDDACSASTAGATIGTNSAGGNGGSSSGTTGGAGPSSAGGASGADGTGGSVGEGGAAGDPGLGGSAGAGGSPPECDGALLPEDDLCVVTEAYGVFVSPAGDDTTGQGTREAPFATLQKGADVASESGKRVYACAMSGDYDAGLVLDEAHAGLEMYGSFACAGEWIYATTLRAAVTPEVGVPLQVSGIETSLELVGFEFASADATEPGASSIAAEVRSSSGVILRNVALLAGTGANGASGTGMPFTLPGKSVLDGVDGTEEEPGMMSVVMCPAGDTTQGGSGGSPTLRDGSAGSPDYLGLGGEGGPDGDPCSSGEPGVDGAEGSPGERAATVGVLNNGSWRPASGGQGGPGLAGQGGGGGSGDPTGGGGSGAAGGCGGAGGGGGVGGGASIALLLLDAEIALLDSLVAASDAGHGGNSGHGQLGQQMVGMVGSPGAGFADGCPGGSGGRGGDGGPGGGGAGGISVGILLQDGSTTQTNTEVTGGRAGSGGSGGVRVDNYGVQGLAQAELDVADL